MNIDQELVKKALLVLNKIDVEIDFNSVGEFVENFVEMSNKVFITWGRIYGFKSMNFEVNGYNYGRVAWDLEDDGFTISDRQGKVFTFYVSGRLEDYDADAIEDNFFEIENDDLGQLRLIDINRLKAIVVACIEDIGTQFKKLNFSMKEIKDELDSIGGLTP